MVAQTFFQKGTVVYTTDNMKHRRVFVGKTDDNPAGMITDHMDNFRLLSVPAAKGLADFGFPEGPWKFSYKAFYDLAGRPRRCALLIDDVQDGYRQFLEDGYIESTKSVLNTARAAGVPIFWSQWCRTAPDDGHYGSLDEFYGPFGCEGDNPNNPTYLSEDKQAICSELQPVTAQERSRVIQSRHYDLFANKDSEGRSVFGEHLRELGIDTVLLTGGWSDACIVATGIRCMSEELNCVLVEDCVYSCGSASQAALDVLEYAFCKKANSAEVIAYVQEWQTPVWSAGIMIMHLCLMLIAYINVICAQGLMHHRFPPLFKQWRSAKKSKTAERRCHPSCGF